MCSERIILLMSMAFLAASCSSSRMMNRIRSGEVRMDISVPDDRRHEAPGELEVRVDSIRSDLSEGPVILNAIRDSETGEMVATDVISASTVTVR